MKYNATFVAEQNEQLDGLARHNRVFFPRSVISRKCKHIHGHTLVELIDRKLTKFRADLKQRLHEDLFGTMNKRKPIKPPTY